MRINNITHLHDKEGKHLLCGQGFFNGVMIVQYPSVKNLPGCRGCREAFLASKEIAIDELTGYPKTNEHEKAER